MKSRRNLNHLNQVTLTRIMLGSMKSLFNITHFDLKSIVLNSEKRNAYILRLQSLSPQIVKCLKKIQEKFVEINQYFVKKRNVNNYQY